MKEFDDYGREVAPELTEAEKKPKPRTKQPETIRKERAKKRRISHGIVLSCDVKKVFRDMPCKDKNNGAELRAVVWSTATQAVFEKRRYWLRSNGEHLNRQLAGLDSSDIRFIADHADEIIAVLDKATSEIEIVKPEVKAELEADGKLPPNAE